MQSAAPLPLAHTGHADPISWPTASAFLADLTSPSGGGRSSDVQHPLHWGKCDRFPRPCAPTVTQGRGSSPGLSTALPAGSRSCTVLSGLSLCCPSWWCRGWGIPASGHSRLVFVWGFDCHVWWMVNPLSHSPAAMLTARAHTQELPALCVGVRLQGQPHAGVSGSWGHCLPPAAPYCRAMEFSIGCWTAISERPSLQWQSCVSAHPM